MEDIVQDEFTNMFCVRCGEQIEVDSLGKDKRLCKECYIEYKDLMYDEPDED